MLKFKFENNPGQFRETLQIIGKYALLRKVSDLFCYKQMSGRMTPKHISAEVNEDFNRLGIPARFVKFHQVSKNTKVPGVTYIAENTTSD